MGAEFNGVCYASRADAADAFFGSASPSFTPGNPGYVGQFVKKNGAWFYFQYSPSSPVTVTYPAAVPSFPACDPAEHFLDGVVVGWGVAAALIAAWCMKLMHKAAT